MARPFLTRQSSQLTGPPAHTGSAVGFNGVAPVAKAAVIFAPNNPPAIYSQTDMVTMKTSIDALRVALKNIGITA